MWILLNKKGTVYSFNKNNKNKINELFHSVGET